MEENYVKSANLTGQDAQAKETKVKPELSEEAKQERLFLSGMLIQQTEDLVKEAQKRKAKREAETIELRSGVKISLAEINSVVTAMRQPYEPKFPNEVPFYKEMYRLKNWTHLDPNDYIKPPIVAKWTLEIIYGRFTKDVLPALETLNPAFSNGIRLHKHFQFLTQEAQEKLIEFRDDAIRVMKTCSSWYEFRKKLHAEYGVPYQIDIFESND